MGKNSRIFGFLALLIATVSLQGCEEIAECVLGVNPKINNRNLPHAFLEEPYFETITAQVDNDAFDDRYIYNFDVYGDLPPGLELHFNRRSIEIYGTPEETGQYRFTVELFVELYDEYGYDGSPTCNEYVERDFAIRVSE